jgi:hypothetical protein
MSLITLYWATLICIFVQFGMSANSILTNRYLQKTAKEELLGLVILHQLFLAVAAWCVREGFMRNQPGHASVVITSVIAAAAFMCILKVACIMPRIEHYTLQATREARLAQDPTPT